MFVFVYVFIYGKVTKKKKETFNLIICCRVIVVVICVDKSRKQVHRCHKFL